MPLSAGPPQLAHDSAGEEQARSGREGDFITGRSRQGAAHVPTSPSPLPLFPPDFVPGHWRLQDDHQNDHPGDRLRARAAFVGTVGIAQGIDLRIVFEITRTAGYSFAGLRSWPAA